MRRTIDRTSVDCQNKIEISTKKKSQGRTVFHLYLYKRMGLLNCFFSFFRWIMHLYSHIVNTRYTLVILFEGLYVLFKRRQINILTS